MFVGQLGEAGGGGRRGTTACIHGTGDCRCFLETLRLFFRQVALVALLQDTATIDEAAAVG